MANIRSRVTYIPNRDLYRNYYRLSGAGLPVFHGIPQNGSGLLSDIFRMAMPILKSAGRTILSSGADVISDIVSGKDLKSSVTNRGLQGLRTVGRDIASTISGKHQGGRVRPASKKTRKRRIQKVKTRNSDIFDAVTNGAPSKRRKRSPCEL